MVFAAAPERHERKAVSAKGGSGPKGGSQKLGMAWKLAFALMLASVTVAALIASGESEDVVAVEQEAVKQLNALREHLFRR